MLLVIHVIDLSSNRSTVEHSQALEHTIPILQVAVNQAGDISHRTLAVLDKNKDLHIVSIKSSFKTFSKLGVYNVHTLFVMSFENAKVYCF